MASSPALHRHYPASLHPIGLRVSAVLCDDPTPCESFAVLASSAWRAYSIVYVWFSLNDQELEFQGLTGYLEDVMYSASGPSTPGLLEPLAIDANRDIAFQRAHTLGSIQLTKISELNTIQGQVDQPVPFTLTTFLHTLKPACYQTSSNARYWACG